MVSESFHCPKDVLCSAYSSLASPCPAYSSFPNLWQLLIFFTVSMILPFLECHILRIMQYVAFSDWLLSLCNMYLGFFHIFHGLIAHFFLAVNNIPLYGYTTVYVFIHLLKDILVASKFWQLWVKLLETSVCRLLCGHKFSTPLVNAKEHNCWIV